MSDRDELKRQVEHLGGQMVGVLAAVDALVASTLQTGASRPDALKTAIRSIIEVIPTNPNINDQELAGATMFLKSVLETVERVESAGKKGNG